MGKSTRGIFYSVSVSLEQENIVQCATALHIIFSSALFFEYKDSIVGCLGQVIDSCIFGEVTSCEAKALY